MVVIGDVDALPAPGPQRDHVEQALAYRPKVCGPSEARHLKRYCSNATHLSGKHRNFVWS